jgi:hypothetical protein
MPIGWGNNPKVTLETFNNIQPGMQYFQVQGLFGDKGSRDIGLGGAGEVVWKGRPDMRADPNGDGPAIVVDFEKGRVIHKTATNLK